MRNELVEKALDRSDALSNALACLLDHDDQDREGFWAEASVLADLQAEAEAELSRLRSFAEYGFEPDAGHPEREEDG